MIRVADHKQQPLFDPWAFLSPKRRRILQETWPGLFRDTILPHLPIRHFCGFFNAGFGRPTKELYTVLGVLILQETFDLTDQETVDQLSYNIQWHYALNIVEESDTAKYICPKTLWNMRSIVVENHLDHILFHTCTDTLAAAFKVNTDKQRMDSVHIKSNMRRLGRINIFVTGIHKFLKNLKRHHPPLFESIDPAVIERYLPEQSLNCFSMLKPSQTHKTLETVSSDLFDLTEQFKGHDAVTSMNTYKILTRILHEQCNLSPSRDPRRVTIKTPENIPSDSLQNPSDPDASYSGHKGQGYQVQIMETYATDEESKAKTLNLITYVEVERAHESDANALIPAIESTQRRNLGPKEAVVDSLYGSDENVEKARAYGVEVVSPVMGAVKNKGIGLEDFITGEKGEVISCPAGHSPLSATQKKNRYCAAFDSGHCSACKNRETCPAKPGKRAHYLRYTDKHLRIAARRAHEKTDAFKERYRWRAGVEATMSEYDRRTGVKHLRVRGFKAVRYCATLKALGINLLRAVAVMIALNREENAQKTGDAASPNRFFTFKEHSIAQLPATIALRARLTFAKRFSFTANTNWGYGHL
jgi:hypothetical protein